MGETNKKKKQQLIQMKSEDKINYNLRLRQRQHGSHAKNSWLNPIDPMTYPNSDGQLITKTVSHSTLRNRVVRNNVTLM